MKLFLLCLLSCLSCAVVYTQPFANPYPFYVSADTELDTSLAIIRGPITEADRLRLVDGHLATSSSRVRLVGTNFEWGTMFPDSATAVGLAKRLRALGINCVRFSTFDYTFWDGGSILAPGTSSVGGGLQAEQMQKFDYFTWQLAQNGIYYAFTFGSAWQPRQDDGIPDSTGFGARIVQFFNPKAKAIHREIIRLLLTHVNPHSNKQYKDDPALAYVVAGEDASLMVYYTYTKAVVAENIYGSDVYQGNIHRKQIDTVFNTWLKKTYSTDAALENAWKVVVTDASNRVANGGFEDAFSPAWQFNVNAEGGTQALFEYNSTDKHTGTQSGRVRINAVATNPNANNIYIIQPLPRMTKDKLFKMSVWLKTTGVPSRKVQFYSRMNVVPYSATGIASEFTITNEWKQYTQEFISTAEQENAGDLIVGFGAEVGDVWIDDIEVVELARTGLRPGESIASNTVTRTTLFDSTITRQRQKDNARFSYAVLSEYYSDVYKEIRDTLQSSVLLCPSSRNFTSLEIDAAKMYDIFSYQQYAYSETSNLIQPYGGEFATMTWNRPQGKAFVVNDYRLQSVVKYHSEMLTGLPAYAAMQDWDGIMFGTFTTGRVGNVSQDSGQAWHLYDKPNILALFPVASRIFQEGHVVPTAKKLLITHAKESAEIIANYLNPYWLRNYTDVRIPLFRTVSSKIEMEEQGSLFPHLDISALANDVPFGMYDAENGQLFMNSNDQTLKVQTDKSISISGVLSGKIFTTPTAIIEQTNQTPHATIVMSALDGKSLDSTSDMLVVLASRTAPQGSVFGEAGLLQNWGQGSSMLDEIKARISIKNVHTQCSVQAVGDDFTPKGTVWTAQKGATQRFPLNLTTNQENSPMFRVRFSDTTTSVDNYGVAYSIAPNPCTDVIRISYPTMSKVQLIDMLGNIVAEQTGLEMVRLSTSSLAAGQYILLAYANNQIVSEKIQVIH